MCLQVPGRNKMKQNEEVGESEDVEISQGLLRPTLATCPAATVPAVFLRLSSSNSTTMSSNRRCISLNTGVRPFTRRLLHVLRDSFQAYFCFFRVQFEAAATVRNVNSFSI